MHKHPLKTPWGLALSLRLETYQEPWVKDKRQRDAAPDAGQVKQDARWQPEGEPFYTGTMLGV